MSSTSSRELAWSLLGRLVATGLLSILIYGLSELFAWAVPYWLCAVIAALLVFFGELLVRHDGDWDFW